MKLLLFSLIALFLLLLLKGFIAVWRMSFSHTVPVDWSKKPAVRRSPDRSGCIRISDRFERLLSYVFFSKSCEINFGAFLIIFGFLYNPSSFPLILWENIVSMSRNFRLFYVNTVCFLKS